MFSMILSFVLLQSGFTSLLVSSSNEVKLTSVTVNCYFKLFFMQHKTCRPANSQASSSTLTSYFQCTFYFYFQM